MNAFRIAISLVLVYLVAIFIVAMIFPAPFPENETIEVWDEN